MKNKEINNPLVVGYKGEIGSFILNGLLKVMPKALNIWCVDINENESEVIDRIQKSDVIFLCIPILKTKEWLIKYKFLLNKKVIIEQTSLKGWLNDPLLKELDIRSMHILFRPSQTLDYKDRKVALIGPGFDETTTASIMEITNSDIIWYNDINSHDEAMAIQQALVHRTLLLLGKALNQTSGSTYISKKVSELCNRIKQGDLELYKTIQDNKHLEKPLNKLIKDLQTFKIEDFLNNKG
jgi:prephenate dehydrogenase